MPSDDANDWRRLYEQAMLAADDAQLMEQVQLAENAIIQRSRQLAKLGQFDEEDTELTQAILSLREFIRKRRNGSS